MPVRRIVAFALAAVLAGPVPAAALDLPEPKAGLRIEFAVRDRSGKQIATTRVAVLESAPGRIVWHVWRGEAAQPSGRNT